MLDRLRLWLWQKRHPQAPWLTAEAIGLLQAALQPTHRGMEWGSGRSTLWLAQRVGHLCSVEHHPEWFAAVQRSMAEAGVGNVEYLHRPLTDERDPDESAAYAAPVEQFEAGSLDFALVDGRCRSACALAVLPKLRPGGLLIVDNCERYLPSNSRAPGARTPAQGPRDDEWARVAERVQGWRCQWTDNGVFCTAIWYVP